MIFTMKQTQTAIPPYNILSLDGGGTWAILQAMALEDLYGSDTPGHTILKNFDLVVANSGGSLVAAGLWANMTPAQLITEFKSDLIRKQIFSRLSFWEAWPRALLGVGPKYFADAKLNAIKTLINKYSTDRNLADFRLPKDQGSSPSTDLIILAYDYDTNRAKFLKTWAKSAAGSQLEEPIPCVTTLAEAVHASTNAPINYFNAPAEIFYSDPRKPIRAWDGAIAGYNNPILAGITEALANKIDRKSIQVLSIGTASLILPLSGGKYEAAYEWMKARPSEKGFLNDLKKLSTSILADPPDVATYTAYFMIDDQLGWMDTTDPSDPRRSNTRIIKLNPLMQPIVLPGTNIFDVPSGHSNRPDKLTPGGFRYLMKMDMDAVKEEEVKLICLFGRLWIDEWVHNQPILAGSTKVECELGQRWYSQARNQARALGLVPPPSADKLKEEQRKIDEKNELEKKLSES